MAVVRHHNDLTGKIEIYQQKIMVVLKYDTSYPSKPTRNENGLFTGTPTCEKERRPHSVTSPPKQLTYDVTFEPSENKRRPYSVTSLSTQLTFDITFESSDEERRPYSVTSP